MELKNTETTIFKDWAAPKIKSALTLAFAVCLWRLIRGCHDKLDIFGLMLGIVGLVWFAIDFIRSKPR